MARERSCSSVHLLCRRKARKYIQVGPINFIPLLPQGNPRSPFGVDSDLWSQTLSPSRSASHFQKPFVKCGSWEEREAASYQQCIIEGNSDYYGDFSYYGAHQNALLALMGVVDEQLEESGR